jgi:hypothetical protein
MGTMMKMLPNVSNVTLNVQLVKPMKSVSNAQSQEFCHFVTAQMVNMITMEPVKTVTTNAEFAIPAQPIAQMKVNVLKTESMNQPVTAQLDTMTMVSRPCVTNVIVNVLNAPKLDVLLVPD